MGLNILASSSRAGAFGASAEPGLIFAIPCLSFCHLGHSEKAFPQPHSNVSGVIQLNLSIFQFFGLD